jgi:hypothetical protein
MRGEPDKESRALVREKMAASAQGGELPARLCVDSAERAVCVANVWREDPPEPPPRTTREPSHAYS